MNIIHDVYAWQGVLSVAETDGTEMVRSGDNIKAMCTRLYCVISVRLKLLRELS